MSETIFETKNTKTTRNVPIDLFDRYWRIKEITKLDNFVIGGGCVRDSLMGRAFKDIDIFVLNSGEVDVPDTFLKAKEVILEKVEGLTKVDHVLEWHKSEPYLVTSILIGDSEVQLMARNLKTVDELLDTFDWNVSLFAYDGEQIWYREEIENIGVGKLLRLQKCTYPSSTLRRGFRFSERFLMKFERKDLEFLCNEVLKKSNKEGIIET
jgi:hypothetical protein